MEQSRWSILYVYLDLSVGREQAGNRSALIVSDEAFNQQMEVVTILPNISLKPGRTVYPNEVSLGAEESALEATRIHLGMY